MKQQNIILMQDFIYLFLAIIILESIFLKFVIIQKENKFILKKFRDFYFKDFIENHHTSTVLI